MHVYIQAGGVASPWEQAGIAAEVQLILASTAAAEFFVIRVCDHDLEKQDLLCFPRILLRIPERSPLPRL